MNPVRVDVIVTVAQNMRNIANAHRETGDDPMLEGVITEHGFFSDMPMSDLLCAFAEALEEAVLGRDVRERDK